ncbi:bifunctional folylpolyglutamate synthase/dihydrofolate synthase [bacterium]|nr:bifunctional folylpolyglutamate synthase/dihydrofolate synthase [bacterium]
MTYTACIDRLQQQAIKKGIDYSLDRLQAVLDTLGNPQLHLSNVVHVAGTNGKGSTVAFIQSIAAQARLSVATFTSPHLESYCERISVNQQAISEDTFSALFNQVAPFLDQGLTEFECLTVMAMIHFSAIQPDITVLEVGLGGRLDATNIVIPAVSVITKIDIDHQAFLGNTISAIAAEKAGIIKSKVPVITVADQAAAAKEVITHVAEKKQAPLTVVNPISLPANRALQGEHQRYNAALAVAAARQIIPELDDDLIRVGLQRANHWGRCTVCKVGNTTYVIDAAHNEAGVKALTTFLSEQFPNHSKTLVFGLHKAKDVRAMTTSLLSLAQHHYYCEFDTHWAASFDSVQACTDSSLTPFRLGDSLPEDEVVVLTGSIYFIGEIKQVLT